MTKREEKIVAMDFGSMQNHEFTSVVESDHFSGSGYFKVYKSEAMAVLGLRLAVTVLGISCQVRGAWRIEYYCTIQDDYGAIWDGFSLYSRVHSKEYYEAWHPDKGYKDRGVHDMFFSQLDEEKLYEECMERVEHLGELEQECIRERYAP